jgi:hypothetical protein
VVERTRVTTSTPESPGVPARNGFNGFLRALPGDRALEKHDDGVDALVYLILGLVGEGIEPAAGAPRLIAHSVWSHYLQSQDASPRRVAALTNRPARAIPRIPSIAVDSRAIGVNGTMSPKPIVVITVALK